MDGARAGCSRSSTLVRSIALPVRRNILRLRGRRLSVIAACLMAWSPDPTGIITPLHGIACAMHSQKCPPQWWAPYAAVYVVVGHLKILAFVVPAQDVN